MNADAILAAHGVPFIVDTRAKFRTGDTPRNIVTTIFDSRGAANDLDALTARPDIPFAYITHSGVVWILRASGSAEIVVAARGIQDAQERAFEAVATLLIAQGAEPEPAEEPKPKRKNRKPEPEPVVEDDPLPPVEWLYGGEEPLG